MKFSFTHDLTREAAVDHIKQIVPEVRSQLASQPQISNIEEYWDKNSLLFAADIQGQRISGSLDVLDKVYELTIKLPLVLRFFEGMLQKTIEARVGKLLR